MIWYIALAVILGISAASAQQKPRVFIEESNSWEVKGSGGAYANMQGGGAWSSTAGGARGQTAELIKTFSERCPNVLVNNNPQIADYDVKFDHEGGKGWVAKRNKIAVFNRAGDSILAHSTRSLGNSVKDACESILSDWNSREGSMSRPTAEAVLQHGTTQLDAQTPKLPQSPSNSDSQSFVSASSVTRAEHSAPEPNTQETSQSIVSQSVSTVPTVAVPVSPKPDSKASVGNGGGTTGVSRASIGAWSDQKPRTRHDGVMLSGVQQGGPADEAGIQPGDLILSIDDHYVYTVEELSAEVHRHLPGSRVAIKISKAINHL